MKNKKTILKGRYSVAILIAITAIICVAFFILGIRRMQNIYSEQMYANELETRQQYLSDTVNNLVAEIDRKHQEYDVEYGDLIERTGERAQSYALASEDYAQGLVDFFDEVSLQDCFSYAIIDTSSNTVLYRTGALAGIEYTGDVSLLMEPLAYSSSIRQDSVLCIFGISKTYLYTLLFNEVSAGIKNREYTYGEYIWMERIDDYEGGDDFATVLVHPGDPSLENTTLSTNTQDEQGNAYNATMLEGILADGEVEYTYWFQEYQSDLISKKIVYSKVYPEYDWVISMGIPAHVIVEFVSDTEEENAPTITRMIVTITMLFVVVFALCMYFVIGNDRKFFLRREASIRNEAAVDELTKAITRKYGHRILEATFHRFRKTGKSPVIMLLDVDKFKEINDCYGHDVGDDVLKKVVFALKKEMRKSDVIIRWGGDEFVGVLNGISGQQVKIIAERMIQAVSNLTIQVEESSVYVTISIGYSCFHMEDETYKDAVKRADEGLYKSKTGGRNQYTILT